MFMVESIKFGYMSKDEVTERVTVCPECHEYNDNVLKDGKGCLYIKNLADVDLKVLRQIVSESVKKMAPRRIHQ